MAPDVFFPKELSDKIVGAILSTKSLEWIEQQEILDKIVTHVVEFGYYNIEGVKKRMSDADLTPADISNFKSYDALFPVTTILHMARIGEGKFELYYNPSSPQTKSKNLDVVCETALREEVIHPRAKSKENAMIKLALTSADFRAMYLAMAGELMKIKRIPENLIINQKIWPNTANVLLNGVVIPSLEIVGVKPARVLSEAELKDITGGGKYLGILNPDKKNRVAEIKEQDYGFVVATHSESGDSITLRVGDYTLDHGTWPYLGYKSTFPSFMRAADGKGSMFWTKSGEPDKFKRGRLTVDRFFPAYEVPTPWTMLKEALAHEKITASRKNITVRQLDRQFAADYGVDGYYNFRNELLRTRDLSGLGPEDNINSESIGLLYSKALREYIKNSIRIGVPSSTWLLKVAFPTTVLSDSTGILKFAMPLSSLSSDILYIASPDLEIRHTPELTPYTIDSIIGHIENEVASAPEFRKASLAARVEDQLKKEYVSVAGVVDPDEFEQMLRAASSYCKPALGKVPVNERFAAMYHIMALLTNSINEEIKDALDGKQSMITVYTGKTKIPIAETIAMAERARGDFIEQDGLGLLKIIYAAFVDQKANWSSLSTEHLKESLKVIEKKVPNSPAFMVTPGNITLYDSVCLFSHILMPSLADQSKQRFTMYVRPSESDVTVNYLIHRFVQVAREVDSNNELGLRTLLQKAYWDRDYDNGFMRKGMAYAKAGFYFGKAKTYIEERFMAALDANSHAYVKNEIEKLRDIARKKDWRQESLEDALNEGVNPGLISDVRSFIERHHLFPETLNAVVIGSQMEDTRQIAQSLLNQVISTRGADCTNVKNVWIPRTLYKEFMDVFEEEAAKLTYGDVMDLGTRLAQYETDFLNQTVGIIKDRKDTRVIPPTSLSKGTRAENPINPKENYTGVIITDINAQILIDGKPAERDILLGHLSKAEPLPWVNFVLYDNIKQVPLSMQNVLGKYQKRSGYPRFLYTSVVGNGIDEKMSQEIGKMSDLFKQGQEASMQFNPYRSHQGGFFVELLVK